MGSVSFLLCLLAHAGSQWTQAEVTTIRGGPGTKFPFPSVRGAAFSGWSLAWLLQSLLLPPSLGGNKSEYLQQYGNTVSEVWDWPASYLHRHGQQKWCAVQPVLLPGTIPCPHGVLADTPSVTSIHHQQILREMLDLKNPLNFHVTTLRTSPPFYLFVYFCHHWCLNHPILKMRKLSPERLRNSPKVTQQEVAEPGFDPGGHLP